MRVWAFATAVLAGLTIIVAPALALAGPDPALRPQSSQVLSEQQNRHAPSGSQDSGAPAAAAVVRAAQALNEGRYTEVATILQAVEEKQPDRAVLLARAAAATGRDDEAEALLKAAAARNRDGDASLELALLLQRLGQKDEARAFLRPLVSLSDAPSARELLRAGRAARALGLYEQANDDLREAAKLDPDDPAINTAWGELFLEKYNRAEAIRCFEAALSADGRSVNALLGLARAKADDNLAEGLRWVRQALQVNSASPEAHVLLGEFLVDAGYLDPARLAAERALAVNARNLEAHALTAAIAYLDNRTPDFERSMAKALAINGTYGEAYRVVAAQAAHHYRFDDAAAFARRAVATDPDNARARADLGMDLLRVGDEEEARGVLKQAFDADPYNVVTYNLLAVLDALKGFETFQDGDLVVRLDRRESAVLREPVMALAHRALQALSEKYAFTPKGPIIIEVFPHHDDFAVRNMGIPGLVGALGACFGRVVTMDSPKAQPPGTFEWSATLWHELTHVVTLQMSNQRVPRWLTEGISVYEEQRARTEWRRPMEEAFVRALVSDQVPAIRDIDASFGDPKTIALAYFHAGLIVGYVIDTYGQTKFNALVRSFADGLDADAAFVRALGGGLDTVQAGFSRSLDRRFGPLRRAVAPETPLPPLEKASVEALKELARQRPDSYDVQRALGTALQAAGDHEGARTSLNRAAELFPEATGSDSPHALLADMAMDKGDRAGALEEMEKQLAADPVNIDLARRMAGMLGDEAPVARTRLVYERIVAVDPFDAEAHAVLGRLALKGADATTAVRELRAAVAAGPNDAAAVRCDLAEAYLAAGDAVQARRETVAVLERTPSYARAQELLLKLVGGDR